MRRILILSLGLTFIGCTPPAEKSDDDPVVIINNGENNIDNNTTSTCGECADGEVCVDGYCQMEGCTPQCDGMSCGDNGCGGVCGMCEGSDSCVDGTCEPALVSCDGFATESTSWTIPSNLYVDDQLPTTAGNTPCGQNGAPDFRYTTFDLTGDGLLDLVVTDQCDSAGVGTNRWEVFENTGSGFAAESTSWAIPSNLYIDDQLPTTAGATPCGQNGAPDFRYTTFDITGDGRPDLVVTDQCDSAGVGTNRWEVFENTGSGFAAESTSWAIPSNLYIDDQLPTTAGNTPCGQNGAPDFRYTTFDINGDARPDLVVTDQCDSAGVGTNRWEVYENTGSGFAAESKSWAIPSNLYVDDQLPTTAGATPCGQNGAPDFRYTTFDITGDGRPDLVLTDQCDSAGVGTNRWEVYENTGSGFAAEPTSWSIPSNLYIDDQLPTTAGNTPCGQNGAPDFRYTTFDINGDARPDLIITDQCDSAGVGTNRWEVYENTGSGFAAEPKSWTIPSNLYIDDQLPTTAGATPCGQNGAPDFRYTTLDLTGEGGPDLVITDQCDSAGVGTNRWEVYEAVCQ